MGVVDSGRSEHGDGQGVHSSIRLPSLYRRQFDELIERGTDTKIADDVLITIVQDSQYQGWAKLSEFIAQHEGLLGTDMERVVRVAVLVTLGMVEELLRTEGR